MINRLRRSFGKLPGLVVAALLVLSPAWAAQPGAEVVVAPDAGTQKRLSAVATDALGNAVVVWRSVESAATGAPDAIFGQRFGSDGSPRGSVFRISAGAVSTGASVAMDGQGNFFVAWAGPVPGIVGTVRNVYGRRYSAAGVPVSDEFAIEVTAASDGGRRVDVAMNPAGEAVVVWDDSRFIGSGARVTPSAISTQVRLQRYTSTGARSGLTQTVASSVDYELPFLGGNRLNERDTLPRVAINNAGQVVVTWLHDDPLGAGVIQARRYALAGAAQGAAFQVSSDSSEVLTTDRLGRPLSFRTYGKAEPDVALDDAGIATFSWLGSVRTSATQSDSGLYFRRYSGDGEPLTAETLLETDTARIRTQSNPRVGLDSTGNAVIAWIGIDLSGFNRTAFTTVAQRLDGNGTPTGPIVLSRVSGQQTGAPALAPFPGGQFVATWTAQPLVGNGTPGDVFGTVSLVRCCVE